MIIYMGCTLLYMASIGQEEFVQKLLSEGVGKLVENTNITYLILNKT